MGSVSDRRKRINAALPHPVSGPIPGSAILGRLIVSGGFDKGTWLPVWRSLSIAVAFWRMIRIFIEFDPLFAEPVYHLFSGTLAPARRVTSHADLSGPDFGSVRADRHFNLEIARCEVKSRRYRYKKSPAATAGLFVFDWEVARLERFRAKWIPVRVKKTRQNKNLELRF